MLKPPKTKDLDRVIEEVGQDIIIRRVTRTLEDGKTTSVVTTDRTVKAIVDEFQDQSMSVNSPGRYDHGDVKFTMHPDVDITYFDKVIWQGTTYNVKIIRKHIKIGGFYVYKLVEGVKEKV